MVSARVGPSRKAACSEFRVSRSELLARGAALPSSGKDPKSLKALIGFSTYIPHLECVSFLRLSHSVSRQCDFSLVYWRYSKALEQKPWPGFYRSVSGSGGNF